MERKSFLNSMKVVEILLLLFIVGSIISSPPHTIGDWIFVGLIGFCLTTNLLISIFERRKIIGQSKIDFANS